MNEANAVALAWPLIFGEEGCALVAFLDRLPKVPVWTIGHGTTIVAGRPVHQGMTCTRDEADAWASADMMVLAGELARLVTVKLTERQMAALISFAYNIGIGHFAHSDVLTALNQGLYQQAADRLLEYDQAGGKRLPDLDARRARERALFLDEAPAGTPAVVTAPPETPTADDLNASELDRLGVPPAQS